MLIFKPVTRPTGSSKRGFALCQRSRSSGNGRRAIPCDPFVFLPQQKKDPGLRQKLFNGSEAFPSSRPLAIGCRGRWRHQDKLRSSDACVLQTPVCDSRLSRHSRIADRKLTGPEVNGASRSTAHGVADYSASGVVRPHIVVFLAQRSASNTHVA